MDELRTVYMIGNHDSPETFLQEEKELISRGYKPLNPVKIVWEYERRFGSLSQEDRRTKLLGHLLRSDGVMLMPGWAVSAEAATEQEVAAFCGKRQVRIF